ncbi:unnamed protein product [Closterium sp. NIES-53]
MAASTSFLPSIASLFLLKSTSALRISIISACNSPLAPCPPPCSAAVVIYSSVRAASHRQPRDPRGLDESLDAGLDKLSQKHVSLRTGDQGERQRSRKSAERQREMGKGKEKAERDQEKENQRPIGEESTPRDAEDGVSSSAGSSSNISGRNNSSSGSSSGSSGGSSGGGERRTRSESRVSLKAGSISERSDADQSLSDRGMEEWEDLHGPVGFEFRVDASRSSGASSSSSSSGGGSGGNGLGGALLAGDGGLQGEEVLELMRMGEGGGMDDVWTDDEALSWPDAGRADWSDAEKWSDAEDWGAAEEWRVRDAWGDDEKWGDDKGLNGREEWGVTENWRAGADRERERAVEAKSQGQIRSHEPDLSGLAFAEQQQAGLPYAVGLASVQQPLDLLWADELSRGQWDGGGEMMGESTGLMGLESVGERQREEGGDGEGVGRKKREKGVKVKVVDLGRLKEKLEGFCKEQGLEPGTMPTRGIFRAARRSDIEKEIQFAGGVHAVAQKLNMQVARKPRGYWDDLANLKQEVLQFQMDHNLPHNKMPSRMLLQKHGRGDLARTFEKWGGLHEVARMLGLLPRFKRPRKPRSAKVDALEKQSEEELEAKANSVVTSASSGEEAERTAVDKREKAKKDYPVKAAVPNKSKKWYSITIEETSDEETEDLDNNYMENFI